MPAAFQLYRKSQTFFSDDGTLLAGGYLKFFEAGTSTPKHIYGEKTLVTDNGVRIDLDASGRPEWAIWGSGQYDVEFYDADDVQVGEDLMLEVSGGEATALPGLVASRFLTNDGDVMSWATIRQLPAMTDHSGDYLTTDGITASWTSGPETPEIPTSPATITSGKIVIGTTGADFAQVLHGTDSVAGGGGLSVSDAVTFAAAFKSTPKVFVQCTGTPGTTSGDVHLRCSVTPSTTGFSVTFSTKTGGTSADSSGTDSRISGTVNYEWLAIGTIDEP